MNILKLHVKVNETALSAATWDAVGGILRGLWYLKDKVSNRKYRNSLRIYFISVPFLGALFGAIIYFLFVLLFIASLAIITPNQVVSILNQIAPVLSGITIGSAHQSNTIPGVEVSTLVIIPFAILAGFNWEWAVRIFKRIGDSFKAETEAEDKIGGPDFKKTERTESDTKSHYMSTEDYLQDPILEKLRSLPEEWDTTKNEMTLNIIADKQDAAWVSKKIIEDVDKGLITSNISARRSEHSSELEILIKSVSDLTQNPAIVAAIAPTLTVLLKDIKFGSIFKRKKKIDKQYALTGTASTVLKNQSKLPGPSVLLSNKGNALQNLGKHKEAIECMGKKGNWFRSY